MQPLNLPEYPFKTRINARGKTEIFDPIRKKYLVLTPEEWVRQQFIAFLIDEKHYPSSLIGIEKGIVVNKMQKRFDAIVYNKTGNPLVLIEFKSPDVKITEKAFRQIAAYNLKLHVQYLFVSNGNIHYCCKLDYYNNSYTFLKEIPDYKNL